MENNQEEEIFSENGTNKEQKIVPVNRGKCLLVIRYVKKWFCDMVSSSSDCCNKEDKEDNESSFIEDSSLATTRSPRFIRDLNSLYDPLAIINKLEKEIELFVKLLKSQPTLSEIESIFYTLGRLYTSGYTNHLFKILSKTLETDFIQHLEYTFQTLDVNFYLENSKLEALFENFLDNVTKYFEIIVVLIPTSIQENFKRLLIAYLECLNRGIANWYWHNEFLKDLIERINSLYKPLSEKPNDDVLVVYPVEFMRRGHVNKNIIHGPYRDVKHYIDTHFRLLKEDFEESLRSGVTLYKDQCKFGSENMRNADVDVYKYVTISVSESSHSNGHIVTFQDTSRLKAKKSDSFKHGSLVLLSSDNFHSFYLALVKDSYPLEKGRNFIRISFIDNPPSFLKNRHFVLLESTNFFEPYFQVLNALLNLSERNFPMYKYIISADTKAKLPAYVNSNTVYEISGKQIKICDNNDWPDASKLNLNSSQMHALRIALTSEFTLIQGPPGTGKTYLCLKIIETLLNNIIPCRGFQPSPILVVCFKNHALDQILGSLLEKNVKLLRLGGQSKNIELKEKYNVRTVCMNTKVHGIKTMIRKMRELNSDMCTQQQRIINYYKQMSYLEDRKGIISLALLQSVIQPNIFNSLYQRNTNRFIKWLLNDIANQIDIDKIIELCDFHKEKILKGDMDVVNCPPIPENSINFDILNECDNFKESFPDVSHILSLYDLENSMKVLRKYIYFGCNNQFEIDQLDDIMYQLKIFKDVLTLYEQLKLRLSSDTYSTILVDLNSIDDIDKLTTEQRWQLFDFWKCKYHRFCELQINDSQKKHDRSKALFDEINDIKKVKKIEKFGAQVVGATTTGAARCHRLLTELKPKIVIIEEAAEVLEAHAVVSLSKHCQHLILIGDHKQLRPNPSSYRLAEKFHLNVSLFERMIENNIYAPVLTLQHRMRPEIAALITPSIYKTLDNNFNVLNYPNVMGIRKNLFFINHQFQENLVANSLSRMNKFEGDLLIRLCIYLLHNGYEPEDITILSTYVAQNEYILAESKKLNIPSGVLITVVDNFQGEENRIILLSLVRCNENCNIGFLSVENRVCVALSRAKEGLFITGNMASLGAKSKLWNQIHRELVKNDSIGKCLPVVCKAHQTITNISSADDITKVLDNGCGKICNVHIRCGHICLRKCHVLDFDHVREFRCIDKCYRRCENGHTCKAYCGDTCPPCKELIDHVLECGHTIKIPCHQITEQSSEEEYDTLDECIKVFRQLTLSNSQEDVFKENVYEPARCKQRCNFLLSCGHSCTRKCHKEDREHAQYLCMQACSLINKSCPLGHKCEKKCSENCGVCMKTIKKKLLCGHTVQTKCYIKPENVKCTEICTKTLDCGHPCKLQCALPCGKCETLVPKVIEKCNHKIQVKCSEAVSQSSCTATCGLILECGHNCMGKCSVPCESYICKEPISMISPACGHKFKMPCHLIKKRGEMIWKDVFSINCTEPCKTKLGCGHSCTGTCGQCVNGRLHKKCTQKCSLKMPCGHNCSSSCTDVVHICNKQCLRICDHSKCQELCSVPCKKKCQRQCKRKCIHFRCERKCWQDCEKKCTRDCPLKLPCGHRCRGICGQKCPKLCLECGTLPRGDNESSRYIVLQDCGHTVNIKSINVEKKYKNSIKSIGIFKCPKCRCPVIKTLYFKEEVNQTLVLVSTVKSFLTENIIYKELRTTFLNKIRSLLQEVENIGEYPEFIEMINLISKSSSPFISCANKSENDNKVRSLFFVINYVSLLIKYYKRFNVKTFPIFERKLVRVHFDLLLAKLNERIFDLSLEQMLQFRIELIKLISIIDKYLDILEVSTNMMKTFTDVKLLLNYTNDINNTVFSESKLSINRKSKYNLDEMNALVTSNTEVNFRLPVEIHNRTMHLDEWFICNQEHIFKSSNNCPKCI